MAFYENQKAMKIVLYSFLILVAFSCKESDEDPVQQQDTVLNEYPDWYTLKAPVDRQIQGVWGNYDKTVLISTMFKLFRTTDQGKQWEQVLDQSVGIMGIVQYQDTLFTMTGLSYQTRNKVDQQVLTLANNFSVDDGKTWHQYKVGNAVLSGLPDFDSPNKFLINPVIAQNKESYRINKIFRDGPNVTTGAFETPGAIKSNGKRIDLPQLHQIQSLYLDDQLRLYIVGSDAVCGSEVSFKFCNSQAGRGVVYVSKNSNP